MKYHEQEKEWEKDQHNLPITVLEKSTEFCFTYLLYVILKILKTVPIATALVYEYVIRFILRGAAYNLYSVHCTLFIYDKEGTI